MSERIVVMNAGAIEQIGTPSEIYDRPRTKFVAQFIGKSNVVEGRVASVGGGRLTIDTPLGMLSAAGSGCAVGDAVELLIRPEKIRVAPTSASERYQTVRGMVRQVVFHGSSTEIHVLVGDKVSLLVNRANERSDQRAQDVRVGAEIQISWPEKEAAAFCNGRRCDYE